MASKIDPFEHVKDGNHIDIFPSIHWGIHLPTREDLPAFLQVIFPHGITKFMILELVAAVLVLLFVLPVVRRLRTGEPPRGWWANAVEFLLLFIRDQVVRPAIPDDHGHGHGKNGHGHGDGHSPSESAAAHIMGRPVEGVNMSSHDDKPQHQHRADKYLPLLWTQFLFILFCNLLGMLPFSGSPTASLAVTSSLALVSFLVIHISGFYNNGFGGYLKSFVPPVEVDSPMMVVLAPMIKFGITAIEALSAFIRSIVLALRLFANMLAGHTALFILLLFIQLVGTTAHPAGDYLFIPVTISSIGLVTALSLLELFVAVLQAYVFTMLTAVFIGLAVAPQH